MSRQEPVPEAKPLFVDRQAALRALEEIYAAIGFVPDLSDTRTLEELRQHGCQRRSARRQ